MTPYVEIPLSDGLVALVDATDAPLVGRYQWSPQRVGKNVYAKANLGLVDGSYRYALMHRLIMSGGAGIDHRNNNGLDNRRENLRRATSSQNNQNSRVRRHSSRYKGVSFCNRTGRWRAYIKVAGKQVEIGRYGDEHEAALAYDHAALKHFGEFARVNLPAELGLTIDRSCLIGSSPATSSGNPRPAVRHFGKRLAGAERLTSSFKGVDRRNSRLWRARLRVHGREVLVGYFTDEAAAARAYDTAALKHFGEFARVNFPSEHGLAADRGALVSRKGAA